MVLPITSYRAYLAVIAILITRPAVKESIKNVAGVASAIFGAIALWDLYQVAQGKRDISDERSTQSPHWMQKGHKFAMLSLKLSLVLYGLVSRPVLLAASKAAHLIATDGRLISLFGANTFLDANPWHPKHVVSIVAAICGVPATIQTVYRTIDWVNCKIRGIDLSEPQKLQKGIWMTDFRARMMTHVNLLSGGPFINLSKWLYQRIYT